MKNVTRVIVGAALLGLLAFAATPVASAKDGDVRAVGSCTKSTTSKIKLSEENGRIEVEFEVDQNRNGRALPRLRPPATRGSRTASARSRCGRP